MVPVIDLGEFETGFYLYLLHASVVSPESIANIRSWSKGLVVRRCDSKCLQAYVLKFTNDGFRSENQAETMW